MLTCLADFAHVFNLLGFEITVVLKQLGIVYCQGYLLGRPEVLPCRAMKATLVPSNTQIQPRYSESAESLCTSAITVVPTLKLKFLSDTFISQPALQAVVVVDNQLPLGIISRATLLELFSTPYGRALHENHAVSEVMDQSSQRMQVLLRLASRLQEAEGQEGNKLPIHVIVSSLPFDAKLDARYSLLDAEELLLSLPPY